MKSALAIQSRSSDPENTGSKQAETQFKPGQSGNPAGRPKGSKNQYAERFWADLQAEWEIGGRAVIKRVMAEDSWLSRLTCFRKT